MVAKRHAVSLVLGALIFWTFSTYIVINSRFYAKEDEEMHIGQIKKKISVLGSAIENQGHENKRLIEMIRSLSRKGSSPAILKEGFTPALRPDASQLKDRSTDTIAVLVFGCNRPAAVKNHVDQLLKLRPSAKQFPVVVSLDCNHADTARAVESYGSAVTLIKQPDQTEFKLPTKEKKFAGYYKIARHYRWALNETFFKLGYNAVIITEDDLDISVDFFEYFLATYPLLRLDPSLWCVSAWNDNGRANMIQHDPTLFWRTDFFPGLGWMLLKDTWAELEPKWPITFWDDWMRKPEQRKGRSCIRPEVPRTSMSKHGKTGVSRGLFFDKHLKLIVINDQSVAFDKLDLGFLMKGNYDEEFRRRVYACQPVTLKGLQEMGAPTASPAQCFRLAYDTKQSFVTLAKALKIMDDFKVGLVWFGFLDGRPHCLARPVLPPGLRHEAVFRHPCQSLEDHG